MAVESIAASLGGAGLVPTPTGTEVGQGFGGRHPDGAPFPERPSSPVPEAFPEAPSARLGGAAEAVLRPASVPDIAVVPRHGGPSIGERMLDRLDGLQRGDVAWSAGQPSAPVSGDVPTLRVAPRDLGPAAAYLRPAPVDGLPLSGPGAQTGGGKGSTFDGLMDQFRQISQQTVQVALVTKTTTSFTGSLNKLLSSG